MINRLITGDVPTHGLSPVMSPPTGYHRDVPTHGLSPVMSPPTGYHPRDDVTQGRKIPRYNNGLLFLLQKSVPLVTCA